MSLGNTGKCEYSCNVEDLATLDSVDCSPAFPILATKGHIQPSLVAIVVCPGVILTVTDRLATDGSNVRAHNLCRRLRVVNEADCHFSDSLFVEATISPTMNPMPKPTIKSMDHFREKTKSSRSSFLNRH